MKFLRLAWLMVVVCFMALPWMAGAASGSSVLIAEVMTASTASASEEFVELHNPGDEALELSGWSVEYKSATSPDIPSSWTRKATLEGEIPPHGFYLVAPRAQYPVSDADWTASLAAAGGHVRLRDRDGVEVDRVGYGATANAAEASPAAAPAAGQSLERLPGKQKESGGNSQDTGNNSSDFLVRQAPMPQTTQSDAEPPVDLVDVEVPIEEEAEPLAAIRLTELLINPMAPLSDDADEYIELHNPNEVEVAVGGYQLRNGAEFQKSYTLPDQSIPAQGYLLLNIKTTKLALTNTEGAVRLHDAIGALIDQTDNYQDAPDGQAWALAGETWQWTLRPTPGQANDIVPPLGANLLAAATTAIAAKPKTAKAAAKTTVRAATKKVSQPKQSSTKKTSAAKPAAPKTQPVKAVAAQVRPAMWLIIVLAILTITYALYEFRHDIRNRYHILKQHIGTGRSNRQAPERGRND